MAPSIQPIHDSDAHSGTRGDIRAQTCPVVESAGSPAPSAVPAPAATTAAPRARRRQAARGGERPRPRALGNNANSAATAAQGRDLRAQRYRARAWLSTVTRLRRVSKCGRVSVIEGGEVLVRSGQGKDGSRTAGLGGLATCGSVWACPVCSAKIAARRTQEIERLLAWNAGRRGTVALATFTVRHHTGHRLRDVRRAVTEAWRKMTSSRAWKKSRRDLGMDGYVRALECTVGDNGWHLHAHVLTLFDGPVSHETVEAWSDELYEMWSSALATIGFEASRKHGVDVRLGSNALDGLGKYLSKITYEAAGGRFKRGRKGGRTPFELLDDAINTGLADDFDLWFEWERDSKGMRQLTWSRGLKDRVGVDDVTDEEIAEEDEQGETIAIISPSSWKPSSRTGLYWHVAELLNVIEADGTDAALNWLDRHGYVYELPPWAEARAG